MEALHDFFENGPLAFSWIDADGTILRANQPELDMLGYEREQYVGHRLTEFHLDAAAAREMLACLRRGEVVRARPARLRCRDGRLRSVRIDASGTWDHACFLRANCVTRDVTEQRRSDNRFRLAVEAAPTAMLMVDEGGRIVLVNAQAEALFGYTRKELTHMRIEELVPERHRAAHPGRRADFHAAPIRRAMGAGRCLFALRKDGSEVPIEIGLNPLATIEGTYVLSSITDLSERDRVRSELEQRNADLVEARNAALQAVRTKAEFLANMSHEIRTPLTAMLGYSELLSDSRLRAKDRADYVATVKRNGDFLLALVNDILDLSKVEAGKLVLEQVDCSPGDLVREVAHLMRGRASGKGLTFEVTVGSDVPRSIVADPTRLRQILVNLIANAIKFTETGGVRLAVHAAADPADGRVRLRFTVSDTGIGMKPEQQARLFEPFRQADAATTRRFGGSGLGLAISARLAEALGGSIAVESQLGRGSIFTLDLHAPLSTTSARPESSGFATRQAQTALRLRGRVLLAEDAPDSQRLIAFWLRRSGAEVAQASNGKEACALVETADPAHGFDAILMDMQMPEMDGYEATTRLRRQGCHVPIIAFTANAMEGDRTRCLDAGCDDYLSKPIDRAGLLACISRHLKPPSTKRGSPSRDAAPVPAIHRDLAE